MSEFQQKIKDLLGQVANGHVKSSELPERIEDLAVQQLSATSLRGEFLKWSRNERGSVAIVAFEPSMENFEHAERLQAAGSVFVGSMDHG